MAIFTSEISPTRALERAGALIMEGGFPKNEKVVEAERIIVAALRQLDTAREHRGRVMGEGPFCGCCGQPKRQTPNRIILDPAPAEVTVEHVAPAGKPDECFWCNEKIGQQHRFECVTRRKTVRVRLSVEFDHDTVESWGQAEIEFHLNESSSCMDNLIREVWAERKKNGCLCRIGYAEVVDGEGL